MGVAGTLYRVLSKFGSALGRVIVGEKEPGAFPPEEIILTYFSGVFKSEARQDQAKINRSFPSPAGFRNRVGRNNPDSIPKHGPERGGLRSDRFDEARCRTGCPRWSGEQRGHSIRPDNRSRRRGGGPPNPAPCGGRFLVRGHSIRGGNNKEPVQDPPLWPPSRHSRGTAPNERRAKPDKTKLSTGASPPRS
jgi:hypothetical protein